jgi:hypothetical protein
VEGTRETDRGPDAKRVRRHGLKRCQTLGVTGVDDVDAAGTTPAAARVDEDDVIDPVPGRQQPEGLAVTLSNLQAARFACPQAPGHGPARSVVTSLGVADPDDPDHSRSNSRRRKWVAHEMQGS